MTPVETALLFVGKPTLALEHFGESLNARLSSRDLEFKKAATDNGNKSVFSAPGVQLVVSISSRALPAESFVGALESPLSAPFRGVLSDTLFRHTRHILVTTIADEGNGAPVDRMAMLRIAHAATTLLAEWHHPAAIHWRQSNQLLVGNQYLRLAKDATPWALFANARVRPTAGQDAVVRTNEISMDETSELIGRPVLFHQTTRPLDEMHAAALSFLRFAVETGAPVPDGHTFGPDGGHTVRVTHVEPTEEMPMGRYDLHAIDEPGDVNTAPRRSSLLNELSDMPTAYTNGDTVKAPDKDERTRSLAISYLMLLLMPPIGVLLLVLNTVFGSNSWRTGVIATASVALALVVGAYTFLNYVGHETAVFIDTNPIQSSILAD